MIVTFDAGVGTFGKKSVSILMSTCAGNFFISSVLFGHNNDFNSGSSYVGFQAIWDVLKNWDPQPLNNAHDHPWNVYEFVQGWRKRGHPLDQTFRDILASHDIPVFMAGDANNDGRVNIADVTATIAQIFQGILLPAPMAQADPNADCRVNIADVIYLIERIFSPGPAPLAGCVEP